MKAKPLLHGRAEGLGYGDWPPWNSCLKSRKTLWTPGPKETCVHAAGPRDLKEILGASQAVWSGALSPEDPAPGQGSSFGACEVRSQLCAHKTGHFRSIALPQLSTAL